MIPNPWVILAAVIFLLVSHAWAFHEGKKIEANAIKAEQLEATNKAIEQAGAQAIADNKLSAKEIKVQEKIKIEYRYIREKANENIDKNTGYADCGLDDDGLRIFNSGAAAEAPSS
ncbi:hypothetical protein R2083_08025 [Nitrosomonas sp. Is35]|uniref:hypothetical protein n=1 Tax=Nitrosomonas sp. Is35 TaxID=3080534 RepID=UPI00294ADC8F|nr:hypothetical protein [Nitrosomonas sp. Is35]MDV6347460.1 hypothetical protein [Nitrosomonas sp. Is35]